MSTYIYTPFTPEQLEEEFPGLREFVQNYDETLPEDAELHVLKGWDDHFHTYVPTFKGKKHSKEWCLYQSIRVSGMNNPMSGPNRLKR